MSEVSSVSTVAPGDASISVNSVQMLFALVQMELSKTHKDQAKQLINAVKANQETSKKYAQLISDVNSKIGSDDSDTGKTNRANALKALKSRCVELGIDGNAQYFTSSKVSVAEASKLVSSLQGLQEQFGTKNQTLMVQIQDLLGQYNANVQGANAAVQQSNNVLQSLAKGG